VGVKSAGGEKTNLVTQVHREALLMAVLAAFAAVIIIELALPPSLAVQKDLSIGWDQPVHNNGLVFW